MTATLDLENSHKIHSKKIIDVLSGQTLKTPPLWMMRQAGRYLPEYQAVRARAGSFLNLCYNPSLAAEVTLQPIRRFHFDAAILFSDILVVPDALEREVSFTEGEGIRLRPIETPYEIRQLPEFDLKKLAPVFETIERVKEQLPADVTFLGFCGAPWTVASYMIAGRGTRDLEPVRLFAYRHPAAFSELIDRLTDASIAYLAAQARSGVDAVQIFDSWAGAVPTSEFLSWCVAPVKKITQSLRLLAPNLKIIAFPREAGSNFRHCLDIGADALGVGVSEDLKFVQEVVGVRGVIQGNLDPLALLAGGDALRRGVNNIKNAMGDQPYIFNLGHGVLPATPVAHVEELVALVRETIKN